MEIPLKYKTLKVSKISEATNLANEIYEYFKPKLSYPVIRGFIRDCGVRAITDLFITTKKLDGKYNRAGYFIKQAAMIKKTIKF